MKKSSILVSIILWGLLVHGSPTATSPFCAPGDLSRLVMMRSNLYAVQNGGSTVLLDGNLTQYGDFSNNLDSLDIPKMSNFSENIGLLRGNITLAVERRKTISEADTIFFKLWNLHQREYQFQFVSQNFDSTNLDAFLEDQYLHTFTPLVLNDTNRVKFSITSDVASANPFRFRIIFRTVPHYLKVTSISAFPENNLISIGWENEFGKSMKKFMIERSGDGQHFTNIATVTADYLAINYRWSDLHPLPANNYYRIRSVQVTGKSSYSPVVKVAYNVGSIHVYPNPATADNLNLKMVGQQSGIYKIRICNSIGQPLTNTSFHFQAGTVGVQKVNLRRNLPAGVYILEVIKPNGDKQIVPLLLQQ